MQLARRLRGTSAFTIVFVGLLGLVFALSFGHRYSPGQDAPYHARYVAVVIDQLRGAGDLYEPVHLYEPNTLLYVVAALAGLVVGPVMGLQLVVALGQIGLPLVTLWALGRLRAGRWGAVIACSFVFSESYAGGFLAFRVAAPLFVAALVLTALALQDAGRRSLVALGVILVALFLLHAHVWLWAGALIAAGIVAYARREGVRAGFSRVRGLLVASAPSLALAIHWAATTYGRGRVHGSDEVLERFQGAPLMGAYWRPAWWKLNPLEGVLDAAHAVRSSMDDVTLMVTFVAVAASWMIGRRLAASSRAVGFLRGCALASLASFFVLPDTLSDQLIAARHWEMGMWLAPLLVDVRAPLLARAPAWERAAVAGLALPTAARLVVLLIAVSRFDAEASGLAAVGQHLREGEGPLAYASVDEPSATWRWNPMFHAHGWVGAERRVEIVFHSSTRETNLPIRYRAGPPSPLVKLRGDARWPLREGLWSHYPLVLAYGWPPEEARDAAALRAADLVAASGPWQLWRRKPALDR
ncbi:MAG: hypothetical protein KF819_22285 [Labilithrix sp.]|nr:hypothetical protein [Labilithrix sp.]